MNTTTTKPERGTNARRKPTGSGSSWKSAIVAASLTGVFFGWAILGRAERIVDTQSATLDGNVPIEQVVITTTQAATSAQAPVVNSVQSSTTSTQLSIPALPQRPVFQQPVTRTRRS
jgi:hypothetical protein